MKKTIALIALCVLFSGCSLIPKFPLFSSPTRPQTVYGWNERETREPFYCEGNVCYKITKELNVNLDQSEKKLSLWERVREATGGILFWTIIAVFVGLVFFPAFTIPKLIGQVGEYRKALKQTTAGLDKLPPDVWEQVRDYLSKAHDADTKVLISGIKNKM